MAWGKDRDRKPVQALPAPDGHIVEKKLAEKFRDAKKGAFCRTLAFSVAPGGTECEWLEAHRVAHNHWVVVRRAESAAALSLPDDGLIVRQDIVKGGEYLPFIEAVAKLAAYETAQGESGGEAAARPSVQELAGTHYRAFALREGLGFDTDNVPRPTADGRIVTPGKFAKGAFDEVSRAVAQAREEAQKETSRILQDTLLEGLPESKNAAHLYDDYMFAWRMLGFLKTVKEILAGGATQALNDKTQHSGDLKAELEQRAFARAKECIGDYHPDSVNVAGVALRRLAIQAMDVAGFYACYVMLRRAMADLQKPGAMPFRDFKRLQDETESRLAALGGSEGDVLAVRAMLMQGEAALSGAPRGLDRLIARFENICSIMREDKPLMNHIDAPPRALFPDVFKPG